MGSQADHSAGAVRRQPRLQGNNLTGARADKRSKLKPSYLLPAAVQHTLQFLGVYACDTKTLRAYNAILGALLPLLLADLINLIRHGPDRATPDAAATHRANRPRLARSALGEALSISQFPLVFFFCFLYYTDVASLFAVLLSYRQALKQKYIASASVSCPAEDLEENRRMRLTDSRRHYTHPPVGRTDRLDLSAV